ncbi:probable serine/threonine-protein kinase At1g54610 isoform X1 [Cryptomeria japonica]|uniref:probable serine/threonine-protein kinase At1g54610 isoform X1 n=1 Tax=Cryptomeria japonica TaxID=3369 RepID=UPI0027D9D246|nr:probable serine/threonine-protein kinase At1g54610 isoform X1 [Cryptomeria japonica]
MGCVCTKQAYVLDYTEDSPKGKGSNRSSTRWLVKEDEESAGINGNGSSNAASVEARKLTGKSPGGSFGEEKSKSVRRRKKKKKDEDGNLPDLLLAESDMMISTFLAGNLPNHTEAEQVAAGWPAWLTAVAGEAIKGWIPRKADSFEKLYKIGQGTYSNVYKARDLDTGKIVALKKVRFDNLEPESVRFMAREIQVLRRLDHPNVVKLEGLVTSGVSCSLYLVFEYMEHDLAGLAACPGIKFTEPQVKCYMQQLLWGLDHCHSRGVLHRDIKGSNLLVDNGGILKIADFGLATFFHPDQRQALTSRVVTLWYRPPELLLGATDYGVAVDLWSTGCILAELLSGKPIMPGRTEVEQLHKIFKLCGSPSEEYWRKSKLPHATIFKPQHPYKCCIAEAFKDFPPSALVLLETLLAIEPADRGRADGALKSEFFTTKPLPCDPSSLPKYPPSKEFDAKIRAEEARRSHFVRQRAAGGRGHGPEAARRVSKLPRAAPTPDGASESMAPAQKQRPSSHRTSNIRNENSNPQPHELLIDPQRSVQHSYETAASASHVTPVIARSGPLSYTYGSGSTATFGKIYKEDSIDKHPAQTSVQSLKLPICSELKTQGMYGQQPVGDLSKATKLAAGRKYDVKETYKDQCSLSQQNLGDSMGSLQNGKHEGSRVPDFSTKQNMVQQQRHESLKRLDSFQLQDVSGLYPQRGERVASREPFMGYGHQEERIMYSGPLLPPSANIDDILKKHERNIQRAVRRARQGKGETAKTDSSFSGRKVFEQKSLVSNPKGYKGSSDFKGELTTSLINTRQTMRSGLTKELKNEEE